MEDRKFEDKVSVEDLFKKPAKEIQIMTYLQAVKTNAQVARNIKDIEENASRIKAIKTSVKDKIGIKELNRMQKIFAWITGSIGFVLVVFNVWDRLQNYYGG